MSTQILTDHLPYTPGKTKTGTSRLHSVARTRYRTIREAGTRMDVLQILIDPRLGKAASAVEVSFNVHCHRIEYFVKLPSYFIGH
jgi:hypothetical protein